MRLVLIVVFVFLMAGCELAKQKSAMKPSVQVSYYDQVNASDIISSEIKYLHLEKSEGSPIGKVYKILSRQDNLYVFDREFLKRIIKYDPEGKILAEIGKLGEAEGEFLRPRDFLITDDRIEVFDRNKFSILQYSLDGIFQSEFKTPFNIYEMEFINDQTRFIYTPADGPDLIADHVVSMVAEDYKTVKESHLPYQNALDDVPFPGYAFSFNSDIIYVKTMIGEFYKWTASNGLIPYFKVDYGKYNWPISSEDLAKDGTRTESIFFKGEVMSVAHNVLETTDFVVFSTYMFEPDGNGSKKKVTDDQKWLCIYHKESNHIWAIKKIVNDIDSGLFPFPIACDGNKFISVLYAEDIVNHKANGKYFDANLFDSVKIDDNPIIMSYSFNTSFFKDE